MKKCAELAYSKHHQSMLAGDMVLEIPTVFQTMLELTYRVSFPDLQQEPSKEGGGSGEFSTKFLSTKAFWR